MVTEAAVTSPQSPLVPRISAHHIHNLGSPVQLLLLCSICCQALTLETQTPPMTLSPAEQGGWFHSLLPMPHVNVMQEGRLSENLLQEDHLLTTSTVSHSPQSHCLKTTSLITTVLWAHWTCLLDMEDSSVR